MMNKKEYSALKTIPVFLDTSEPILAASIIDIATVQSIDQELGETIDLSAEPVFSEKHFCHEWE